MIWSGARQASPLSKAPLNGPFGTQRHDEMDLPRDLAEAASRIEVLPGRILVERLDSDVCQPGLAEIVEGMVNLEGIHRQGAQRLEIGRLIGTDVHDRPAVRMLF